MHRAKDSQHSVLGPNPPHVISVEVSPQRVAQLTLVLQTTILATVFIERTGRDLPIVRELVTFLYLTFVPGYLLLHVVGVSAANYTESLVYTVGLSLMSLMAIGALANFGLRFVGVAHPFREIPMILAVIGAITLLLVLYYRSADGTHVVHFDLGPLRSPLGLGLALLPFLAIYGGLLLTRFDVNLLLLVLYGSIASIPVLIIYEKVPYRLFPVVVWVIAVSLLLQNTLTGQYLAWGDQPKEATIALYVLQTGVWDPALAPAWGSKFAMLRIVILHPLYALFTGLKMVWVFKFIHPLLFSVMPVALYHAYRRFITEKSAFLSAYLFISLFSFFIVLSRNTRTATALFFLALVALLVADDDLSGIRRKFLMILFGTGIVVSHYGVSYMILFGLVTTIGLLSVIKAITGRGRQKTTTASYVLLYTVITFTWYMYASPRSKAFSLIIGFGEHFFTRLSEFLISSEASATTRYVTTDFHSVTLDLLKIFNLVIGVIIVIGLTSRYWMLYRDDELSFSTEYLAYASVFLGIFAVTFLPVERFNTARTFPTTLLFFAPFFVIGVRNLWNFFSRTGVRRTRAVQYVSALLIVFYFLLNVGFISATVTHEYSPNAFVEKERIMEHGHPVEKVYFYKQYPTEYAVRSTDWFESNFQSDSTVHMSSWPGTFRGAIGYEPFTGSLERHIDVNHEPITRRGLASGSLGEGYVYLNGFNVIGNVIRFPSGHFGFDYVYTSDVNSAWSEKNRIYTNGGSTVCYG
ncbi:DUF2206 domain-containing protein [Halorussus salinisoli]|uniref:DUF2206 domain-containing protein n=1 Tax=Halorussus salinisoli TaxID=2558242 RepID=UPI0010C1EE8E|nr:DUF2206 domain-containing protein [Halorussus salinisoli]